MCVCVRERERGGGGGGVFAVATIYGAEYQNVTRGTISLEKISPTYPLIMGCLLMN